MLKNPIAKALLYITLALTLIVTGGIVSAYALHIVQSLTVMLALVGAITYFGLLALPGGWTESEGLREGRIRLVLASAFVMVYLVYLATVIFWMEDPAAASRPVFLFAEKMLDSRA